MLNLQFLWLLQDTFPRHKKKHFFIFFFKIKSVCVVTVKMSRLLNFDVACFVFFLKDNNNNKKASILIKAF